MNDQIMYFIGILLTLSAVIGFVIGEIIGHDLGFKKGWRHGWHLGVKDRKEKIITD